MVKQRIIQDEVHKESKRTKLMSTIDKKFAHHFANIAKFELFKAKARDAMASCPKEDGYVFIPNKFMDELLKSDLSVEQFNEVLRIFDPRRSAK
ncbi:hypothetical protein QL224_15735 [Cronobacter dublinensis]|uniref:hypothetical protein n=1 Tax=Cronobacter dublinensis TaxID=413497 RepID=UPI0024ACBA7D|nr:hypothetical protein [Cronobacter dublinensis]MDI6446209.1 hypothetical protein [Cronobacter dublinensis]